MPVQKLHDSFVASLACPDGHAHIEYFDTLIRGLYVDVLANGRMAYRVRYRQEKKKRSYTLGDARLLTVDEAREKARTALRQVLAGGDPRNGDIPLHGPSIAQFYMEMYMPFVKSYKRSWGTDETMIRNHLIPALGNKAMGEVIPPDIAAVVAAMKEREYAPGTINRLLVMLRYGYTLAQRWRVEGVDGNPAKEVNNIKEDNKIERYLTPAQTKSLLEAVRSSPNPMLGDIVAFLLFTGARKREALDAKWRDIDWQQQSWRIPKTKSGKIRHIPLSSGAVKLLRAVKNKAEKRGEYIFPNPQTGPPFVSIFYSWDAARTKAGLRDLRIHDLRHSFASFLVNAGRSLYEVQELLGHANIRTTSRYAHLSRERLRDAVEVVQMG